MVTLTTIVLSISQVGLSLWAASYSYAAIIRLQTYEDTSEKAAKVSSTARHELHKTRTTQTSGVLTIVANLIWALVQLSGTLDSASAVYPLLGSLAIGVGSAAARIHLSSFWDAKTGVPFIQNYNDGIRSTKQLVEILFWISTVAGVQAVYYAGGLIFG